MPAHSSLRRCPTKVRRVSRVGFNGLLPLGAALLLAWSPALAGITPLSVHSSTATSGQTHADPRATLWTYDLALLRQISSPQVALRPDGGPASAEHLLLAGGSFTLMGFSGYVDQSCLAPTGWTCVASQLGLSDNESLPDDSAVRRAVGDVVNLTWTYRGPKIGGTVQGLALGSFSAESMAGGSSTLAWAASGLPAGAGGGAAAGGDGNGVTPMSMSTSATWLRSGGIAGPGQMLMAIPEPSSLALSALAVALVLGLGLTRPARAHRPAAPGQTG